MTTSTQSAPAPAVLDAPGSEPKNARAGGSLSLGRPPAALRGVWFWIAVALGWAFFGFIIGNHMYFGMRSHGHSWGRLVLWQMAGAGAWVLLTPAVLALDRRFPFRYGNLAVATPVHAVAAVAFGALRLVPLTSFSRLLDPFRPVAREPTFWGEYLALAAEWVHLDVLIYAAILFLARVVSYREQHYRDVLRASRLQAELSAAELRALELEIHPHFLFNSLNAIAGLVREGDQKRSEAMVVGLADLVRLTLQRRGRQMVSLGEELRHVDLYLDLQKARFGERLTLAQAIEPEAVGGAVPGLMLQPLVENAIRHGIERRRLGGTVTLSAARKGERLEIGVQDEGPGQKSGPSSSGAGIGLDNLRSRLEALFDDRWDLRLEPLTGGGTRARVMIPWIDASRSGDLGAEGP
ncbi:MAG: histidine kinase [Acidobacteriota bacterium]